MPRYTIEGTGSGAVCTVALPPKPAGLDDKLSTDDLKKISGGQGATTDASETASIASAVGTVAACGCSCCSTCGSSDDELLTR